MKILMTAIQYTNMIQWLSIVVIIVVIVVIITEKMIRGMASKAGLMSDLLK